jgi:hypothetical protein
LLVVALSLSLGIVLLTPVTASADTELQLQPGFNEFVYSGESAPVAEALSSIDGFYDVVFHWDVQAQVWRSFRPPPAPAFLSDFELMEVDNIYWVLVAQSLLLTIVEPVPLPPSPSCEDPIDGPFMRSSNGMWAVAAEQIGTLGGLLDELEQNPSRLLFADRLGIAWFTGILTVTSELLTSSQMLVALVADDHLAGLEMASMVAGDTVLQLTVELTDALLVNRVGALLALREFIDSADAAHQAVLALAAAWCEEGGPGTVETAPVP